MAEVVEVAIPDLDVAMLFFLFELATKSIRETSCNDKSVGFGFGFGTSNLKPLNAYSYVFN